MTESQGMSTQDEVGGKERQLRTNGAGEREHTASAARDGAMVSQVHHPQYMKLANPGPLGLLSFAITTFVVGLYECGAG